MCSGHAVSVYGIRIRAKREELLRHIIVVMTDYVNGSESSVLCRNAVSANIKNTTPPISVTVA